MGNTEPIEAEIPIMTYDRAVTLGVSIICTARKLGGVAVVCMER